MSERRREQWLAGIRANIESAGYHVTLVAGGATPRFAYTIGLTEREMSEIMLAGAAGLSAGDVTRAIEVAVGRLDVGDLELGARVEVDGVGAFRVGAVHDSWAEALMLGVNDIYDGRHVGALQLFALDDAWSIDVPDLSQPWSAEREPVWRWLHESWPYPISMGGRAVTNLDALRGAPISEAARWENDEWELFAGAGPEVSEASARVVPLATLLGSDRSLEPVTRLAIGQGIWRDPPGEWQPWPATTQPEA